jgi:hypothetical protein
MGYWVTLFCGIQNAMCCYLLCSATNNSLMLWKMGCLSLVQFLAVARGWSYSFLYHWRPKTGRIGEHRKISVFFEPWILLRPKSKNKKLIKCFHRLLGKMSFWDCSGGLTKFLLVVTSCKLTNWYFVHIYILVIWIYWNRCLETIIF